MRGCFFGACRHFWKICSAICPRRMRRFVNWRRLLGLAGMLALCGAFIRGWKIFLWITRLWSRLRLQRDERRVFVIPAKVGWSDIGSWAAVYELLAPKMDANVSAGPFVALEALGNFFWSPNKLVAAVGVKDLVLVDTPDAILICPRERAQDVGKIVKWIEEQKLRKLL